MNYISPKEEVLKVKRWPKNTIAAGRGHTVALKSDGTVVAVGRNKEGECNVSSWCDIEAVAAGNVHMATNTGNAHTIALKSNNTVEAVGWNKHGQCDVNDWHNIVAVAASISHQLLTLHSPSLFRPTATTVPSDLRATV